MPSVLRLCVQSKHFIKTFKDNDSYTRNLINKISIPVSWLNVWLENRTAIRHRQRIEIDQLSIGLVDQNGLEFRPKQENDKVGSGDKPVSKFFDKDKTFIDKTKADVNFLKADWSRFLSPGGELRIRCRFGIKNSQDFWTTQAKGFSLAENLTKDWNSGDFSDAALVISHLKRVI